MVDHLLAKSSRVMSIWLAAIQVTASQETADAAQPVVHPQRHC